MALALFRLSFNTTHFGDGSLESSSQTLRADTLFSALCLEALRSSNSKLDEFVAAARAGTLRFSDALPFVDKTYFLPKPIIRITSGESSSTRKKTFKQVSYIPLEMIDEFIAGRADANHLLKAQNGSDDEKSPGIGKYCVYDRVFKRNGKDDAEPYRVGAFHFSATAGLWLIASGEESEVTLATELLTCLAETGVGGERSSGMGRFSLSKESVPETLKSRVNSPEHYPLHMALTTCLPADDELASVLDGASSALVRRSGFVASRTYADTLLRKRDLYKFAAGSAFTNIFDGDVFDVQQDGSHPVWSYAKPIWFGLKRADND